MKRAIFLLFLLVLILCLCACGDNTNKEVPSSDAVNTDSENSTNLATTSQPEQGTLSNPYSMSDTIEFISHIQYTESEMITVNIGNMVLRDDITITGYDPGQSRWFVTFTFEVVESDADELVSPWLSGIDFGNVNTDGIGGEYDWLPRGLNTTANVTDFKDLELLPGFSANVGTVLVNESGGDLYLITIKYYDVNGEKQTVYIDPNV